MGAVLAGAGVLAAGGCADVPVDSGGGFGAEGAGGPKRDPKPGNGERITVVATGDVLLHERLWTTAKRDGANGNWDFAPLMGSVEPLVRVADLAVCHLETPLAPLGGPYHGYPLFQGPPQIAAALKQTGYDVCTTASNHSFDAGAAGVDRTLNTLERAGLRHAGTARTRAEAETPTIIDVRGVKVVSCHWGDEYSAKLNAQQREVAPQLLADSNIDLVLGHHAHVVQPMEQINGKWVAYGLGNLVAAHREPTSTKAEGLLVRFTFRRDGDRWTTAQAEYAPLLMTDALPVRVLDVRRELAKPGLAAARRRRLELAERRTTATVRALGATPEPI